MSEAAVLQALQCACSQDPSVLKIGEQQLKAWETEKGFYSTLAVRFIAFGFNPTTLLSRMSIMMEKLASPWSHSHA